MRPIPIAKRRLIPISYHKDVEMLRKHDRIKAIRARTSSSHGMRGDDRAVLSRWQSWSACSRDCGCTRCMHGSRCPLRAWRMRYATALPCIGSWGGDFAMRKAPDATTPLKFRHILKDYEIGEKIFTEVCDRLNGAGLVMYGSTIVDASISTFRRPRRTQQMKGSNMHQSKKGNERRFGMKMRTVTDAGTIYTRAR